MLPQTPTKKYVGSIVTCTQLNVMLKWERSSTYTCTWIKESLQWNLAGKRVDLCKDRSTYQPLPTLLSRWTAYLLRIFFLRMLSTWPCEYQVHRLSCSSQTCRRVVTNRTRKATLSWNVHYLFFYTFILSITNIFNSGAKRAPWTHARKSSDAEVKWGTQVLHPWSLKDFFFLWSSLLRFLGEHLCPTPLSPIFFFTYVDNSKMPAAQCKKLPFFYASLVVYLY